uniref:RanBP2-type domain-containing protein n=1 Tax=Macrostomum lignano TaxID=282301 RepID=A0A1I8FU45_9PLAT
SASSTSNGNCASPFSLNFSASSGQAVAPSPSGFASVVTASDVADEMQSLPLDQVPAAVKLLRRAFRQPQLKLIEDPSTLRQLIRLVHCQPVVSLNAMEDVARLTAQEARNRLLLNLARQPLVNYKRSTDFLDLMCCEYRGLCGNGRRIRKIEPLRCLLILDGEMRRVRCKWEEAQPALARWREAQQAIQRDSLAPESCVTTPEDLALGSASGPFVTCERCSQTVCTCPNCKMSHYITCGVLAPRPTLDGSSTSLPYNDDDEEFEEKFMAIADGGAKEKSAIAGNAQRQKSASNGSSNGATGASDDSDVVSDDFSSDREFDHDDNELDPVVEQFKSFVLNSPAPTSQRQRVSCLDMQSLVQQMASSRGNYQ